MTLAKLVAITLPMDDIGDAPMSPEEFIAFTARVSNPANQNNTATADKLIRYLIKNKHWSPFEMVHMVIEINTTRDIGRQILRHRSFSFQEFSQRYAQSTEFVTREARLQDTKNRQNSISTDNSKLQRKWLYAQRGVQWLSTRVYRWALGAGIAKEQARAVLPEGMTATRMYMSGTLRSFIHYCDLRCGNGTQLEHKEVADAIMGIMQVQFPNIAKALEPEQTSSVYIDFVNNGALSVNDVKKLMAEQKSAIIESIREAGKL